jgi:hypothetical protein
VNLTNLFGSGCNWFEPINKIDFPLLNKVYTAYNGLDALKEFGHNEKDLDLVITDLVMPFLREETWQNKELLLIRKGH